MVRSQTLSKAIATRDRDESPDWSDGSCDRCERDALVLATTAHPEFDELCLVCADHESKDGDLTVLVEDGR